MSQEDLKEFIEFEKKSKLIKIKLNEILSICNESEDFYSIKNLCKNQIDEINSNIEVLKKYSLCEHIDIIKDVYHGHDSHYDYYQDICKNCGKILNEDKR